MAVLVYFRQKIREKPVQVWQATRLTLSWILVIISSVLLKILRRKNMNETVLKENKMGVLPVGKLLLVSFDA